VPFDGRPLEPLRARSSRRVGEESVVVPVVVRRAIQQISAEGRLVVSRSTTSPMREGYRARAESLT
jgi:hypothetical protein